MTRDENAPDPSLFDRRIVERNIKRGLIARKDYDRFLKALPDAADKIRSPDEPVEASPSPAGTGTPPPSTQGPPA
jgi:hypothetical protein